MTFPHRFSFAFPVVVALVMGALLPAAGEAQLSVDRFFLLPEQRPVSGAGAVRLDGMGSLEIAVRDENNEINLWDYSDNPAGYGDDKDSWSVDIRYTHNEFVERGDATRNDDIKFNNGIVELGLARPGNIGVGGRINYNELDSREYLSTTQTFSASGFSLFFNKYLGSQFSIGARLETAGESETRATGQPYTIDHSGRTLRGGLALAWLPVEGVTLAARGDLIQETIDGESVGPFHTDTYEWERPGGLVGLSGFIARERFQAGIDFTRKAIEGEETIMASWSERFQFNPTPDAIAFTTVDMTEERTTEVFKVRGAFDISPKVLLASASFATGGEDLTVLTHPNAPSSLAANETSVDRTEFLAGLSWLTLKHRLLLAGEIKLDNFDVNTTHLETTATDTRNATILRIGGEYMFGETMVGRAGFAQTSQDLTFAAAPELDGAYSNTRMTVGLGVVPMGAIWQIDIAWEIMLNSDLDADQNRFQAYMRYLF